MNQSEVQILISEADLHTRILALAAEIALSMTGETILVIGLCKGAFVFTADLVRALAKLGIRMEIDFMVLASYGAAKESSGVIEVKLDCTIPLAGRRVLLLDDILDTGKTMTHAVAMLRTRGADRIQTAVLLDKPERRTTTFQADFVGFTIPDRFVVGCGIDYAEQYRELPYIGYVV